MNQEERTKRRLLMAALASAAAAGNAFRTTGQCHLSDRDFRQCCCLCEHHRPVHYHCTTHRPEGAQNCVCSIQHGWACIPPEFDGRIFDRWPEHSIGCEMFELQGKVIANAGGPR